jgi:hypothetical protein
MVWGSYTAKHFFPALPLHGTQLCHGDWLGTAFSPSARMQCVHIEDLPPFATAKKTRAEAGQSLPSHHLHLYLQDASIWQVPRHEHLEKRRVCRQMQWSVLHGHNKLMIALLAGLLRALCRHITVYAASMW